MRQFLAVAPLWLSLFPAFYFEWLPWWYAFVIVPGAVWTCYAAELIGESHRYDRKG